MTWTKPTKPGRTSVLFMVERKARVCMAFHSWMVEGRLASKGRIPVPGMLYTPSSMITRRVRMVFSPVSEDRPPNGCELHCKTNRSKDCKCFDSQTTWCFCQLFSNPPRFKTVEKLNTTRAGRRLAQRPREGISTTGRPFKTIRGLMAIPRKARAFGWPFL